MSGTTPVDPSEVPVFTGNICTLQTATTDLSTDGAAIATATGDVHSTFGGLSAFYRAPEAEQLFATTKPVADTGLDLSSEMCTIVGALGTYAQEIQPLTIRLDELRREAAEFRLRVADDDTWREDGDLVNENNSRRNEIAEVWSAFQAAEIACHNKIVALVGGTSLKLNDGSDGANTYGYEADLLTHAEDLPWGEPVKESTRWYQVWEHAYDFGKGVVVDGAWAMVKGLGTLAGVDGWESAKQAWTGLGKLGTALAITAIPSTRIVYLTAPEDTLPPWLRESRTVYKETGKALVAWDLWSENPARASGAVTFNVLTTIFSGGVGSGVSGAGKAGAAAKILSAAGKAGRALDPVYLTFKAGQAAGVKLGDMLTALRSMGTQVDVTVPDEVLTLPRGTRLLPDGTFKAPEGAPLPQGVERLPDGTLRIPEGAVALPEGSTKVTAPDGKVSYFDPRGNLYKADGSLDQYHAQARQEPAAPPVRVGSELDHPVPIGARPGGSPPTAHASANPPGDTPHLPPTRTTDPATPPSASHEPPPGPKGGHGDGPTTGGHDGAVVGHDGPSSGGHGGAGDGAWLGDDVPGTSHSGSGGGALDEGPAQPFDLHGIDPSRFAHTGNDLSLAPTGPMKPEQEAGILAELSHAKMELRDQQSVIRALRKDPYGAGVAELINRGHLRNAEGYEDILSMCKKGASRSNPNGSMIPAAHMALSYATELQSRGVTRIGFELGDGTTPWDLDVYTRSADGNIDYGYQLKDVNNVKKIGERSRSAASQLVYEPMRQRVAILDVHQPISKLTPRAFREAEEAAELSGATFVLRFEDGAITIPPNGSVFP